MNRLTAILCLILILFACGKKETDEKKVSAVKQPKEYKLSQQMKNAASEDLLQIIARDPSLFSHEFNKFNSAEKYYFCAAFTMGAMSVSKPITASAMVNYFIGLGVVHNNEGINDTNYRAFDFGKNIFHFEPVVNTILHKKICENIIGEASQSVKKKHLSTKEINAIGKTEVKKIVGYIKKKK